MNDFIMIKDSTHNKNEALNEHIKYLKMSKSYLFSLDIYEIQSLLISEDYLEQYTGLSALKLHLKEADDVEQLIEQMNIFPTLIYIIKGRITLHHVKVALQILSLTENSCNYLSIELINNIQTLKEYKIFQLSYYVSVLTRTFIQTKEIKNLAQEIDITLLQVELAQYCYNNGKKKLFSSCIQQILQIFVNSDVKYEHYKITIPALCTSLLYLKTYLHVMDVLEALEIINLHPEGLKIIEFNKIESKLVSYIQNEDLPNAIKKTAMQILSGLAVKFFDAKNRILNTQILDVAATILRNKSEDLKPNILDLLYDLSGQTLINCSNLMSILFPTYVTHQVEYTKIILQSVKNLNTKSCELLMDYGYLKICENVLIEGQFILYKLLIESLVNFFNKVLYQYQIGLLYFIKNTQSSIIQNSQKRVKCKGDAFREQIFHFQYIGFVSQIMPSLRRYEISYVYYRCYGRQIYRFEIQKMIYVYYFLFTKNQYSQLIKRILENILDINIVTYLTKSLKQKGAKIIDIFNLFYSNHIFAKFKIKMDQNNVFFHIHKASLIKKNFNSIQTCYQYENKDKIGQGAYGKVYRATHRVTKQVRAVKVINKGIIKYKERLMNEITIMEQMDHPNVLRLFETFEDNENLYMVLEICQGGDVFDKVLEKGNMTVDESFKIYLQFMRAVNYYQGFNIVHRDLKPENFLFHTKNDLNTLNVIDFGIAKRVEGKLKTKSGTAYYVAPEVLEGSYDNKCDIWSAGVILYVILCGYPPFYGENEKEILTEIKSGNLQFEGDEWAQISQDIKDFVQLHICPAEQRLSSSQLLNHQLLEGFIQKFSQDFPRVISMNTVQNWCRYNPLKRLSLLYLSTQLDFNELKNQKLLFSHINSSQTGLITQDELAFYLKITKVELKQYWQYLDVNDNEYLDYFEFIAISLQPKDYQKQIQLMFEFLSDQQQLITQQTVQKIFEQSENLNSKWESISENKNPQKVFETIDITKIIDKDLDFTSYKLLMG
ncbi:hypothetical protein pb186bvf_004341 [Paramecium bursaria]